MSWGYKRNEQNEGKAPTIYFDLFYTQRKMLEEGFVLVHKKTGRHKTQRREGAYCKRN